MSDTPRLIERAFPLKQASLDSVHEKNVRHGHISTLHIWPARRPLAACRAALIATLLPDPGTPEKRQELCEKIGGKVVKKIERKKMPDGRVVEREKEETEGGILHWKRETENAEDLEWFRQEIRKAYGGRAPRVLDPFAGGGAIPLEAMRLGCEATAVDINPVAWFIQKCTLEYPQKLAGKTLPLPEFILEDEEFMGEFYKAHPHLVGRTKQTKQQKDKPQPGLWDKPDSGRIPKADLAWHVRAWGKWVLNHARRELASYYPTYADFEPLDFRHPKPYEKQPLQLVPLKENGTANIDVLNAEFSDDYLNDKRNPRWVVKPTVAYLWTRTVTCKNCRVIVPLLKTRWLCRKASKRILLTMEPTLDKSDVVFGIDLKAAEKGGNSAQKREHDKRIGDGDMSRSGASCVCCGTIMTMEDIRLEGQSGRLSSIPNVVVVDGQNGKEYRPLSPYEKQIAMVSDTALEELFSAFPYGMIDTELPKSRIEGNSGFRVILYGIDTWRKLFASRQLYSIGMFVKYNRLLLNSIGNYGYDPIFTEAISAYLGICVDRIVDSSTTIAHWQSGSEFSVNTLQRFALPMSWDFSEVNTTSEMTGSFNNAINWVALTIKHFSDATLSSPSPSIINGSATQVTHEKKYDLILTDPPYYDAIAYSDVMDLFYNWLRRTVSDLSEDYLSAFGEKTGPKWDYENKDGELIDDPSRFGGNKGDSKNAYESGMATAFRRCYEALLDEGRLVIVFAHKHPNAWETLVSAIIQAGFVVNGSWPIQTERAVRSNALKSASLSSSVWLVCKKRPVAARPGWDNIVLEEMRHNISERLREYWDAGIRGPDFVWAATGPAMEAYSKHPVVKKANEPGQILGVSEFLTHVRRMVVDYVVGQVLTGEHGPDLAAAERMDAPTAYYLLHRHDFGLEDAPVGACILYATACGLSDHSLDVNWDILSHAGSGSSADYSDEETETDSEAEVDGEIESGSKVKLKAWTQRKNKNMGFEAPGGQPVPLIDRVHRLMHLWKAGDAHKVDEYLDDNGLRRQELFKRLLQSLIELSSAGSEERTLMESLSNHIQAKGATPDTGQGDMGF